MVDFRYIWLAGRLWIARINPYAASFSAYAREFISPLASVDSWLYPPHWFPISALLAQLDFELAVSVWKWLNGTLLVAASFLVADAIRTPSDTHRIDTHRPETMSVVLGYVLLMQASAIALSLGQTSPVVFAGLGLVLSGLQRDKKGVIATGLLLMSLKPQIGAFYIIALLFVPRARKPIGIAGVVAATMTMGSVLTVGVRSTFLGFLHNLGAHGNLHVNGPAETSGIRNIYFILSHEVTGSTIPVVIGFAVLIFWSVLIAGRTKIGEATLDQSLSAVGMATVAAALAAPLHSYDWMIVIGAAPFLVRRAKPGTTAVSLAAGCLLLRADNLAEVVGFVPKGSQYFGGSSIASVAFVLLSVAFVSVHVSSLRREKALRNVE